MLHVVILQFKINILKVSISQPEFNNKPPITSFELPSDVFFYIQALLDAMRPPLALEAPPTYLALPAPHVVEVVSQPVSIISQMMK